MEEQGAIAGSASALMGTIQMIVAAVVMGVVGVFADNSARPMVVAFAACATLAFAITQLTLRQRRPERMLEIPAE
jgi:DHA1 family bicyclomycin/chloramphenicol resistance-like MFS transporter